MKPSALAAVLGGLALLTACGKGAEPTPAADAAMVASAGDAAPASGEPCADDGPRLPLTGLCASRAVNYLNPAEGGLPEAPDGCEWAVEETEMAGGDVLLFRALQCGDKVTKLAWSADEQSARLTYESSARGHRKGDVAVVIAGMDDGAPGAGLLAFARAAIGNSIQAGKCSVRRAGNDAWPADALVVDDTPGADKGSACGPYGFDRAYASFWREFQHQAWFFRLGPDQPDIDPGSFTLLARNDENGAWEQAQ